MNFVNLELRKNNLLEPGIDSMWNQKEDIESYLQSTMPKNFIFYTSTLHCFPLVDYHNFLKFNFFVHIQDENFFTNINRPEYFLLINFSAEGNKINRLIDIIENLCNYYNIPYNKVILSTGNIDIPYPTKINILSYNLFQSVVYNRFTPVTKESKKELKYCINECEKSFKGKFFSNLSRIPRDFRSIASCVLYQKYSDIGLFSHGKECNINHSNVEQLNISSKEFKKWKKKLPIVLDKDNFDRNWALDNDYYHIHDQTLFQIVNETLVTDPGIFYSEKTFRPMTRFQPFIIWGQKGINTKLQELGFKTYNHWFDLSFDNIKDDYERLEGLLESVSKVITKIDGLSNKEKIEWRFNNRKVLMYNYNHLSDDKFNKNQINLLKQKIR